MLRRNKKSKNNLYHVHMFNSFFILGYKNCTGLRAKFFNLDKIVRMRVIGQFIPYVKMCLALSPPDHQHPSQISSGMELWKIRVTTLLAFLHKPRGID